MLSVINTTVLLKTQTLLLPNVQQVALAGPIFLKPGKGGFSKSKNLKYLKYLVDIFLNRRTI